MFPTSLKPEWRNGRRDGLKIRYSKGCVGSTPTSGTNMDTPTLTDVNLRGVAQRLIEKRLRRNSETLKQLRIELAVLEEQLEALRDDAREKELRSLVSETPLALHEFRDAQKHVDAAEEQCAHLQKSIRDLTKDQDDLLDKLGRNS
jgi:chromosome segregation ATPase